MIANGQRIGLKDDKMDDWEPKRVERLPGESENVF